MKLVIQKVSSASVEVEGSCVGKIGKGFLVLVGIGKEDTREVADQFIKKMVNLRIFADENGKTNLSLADVNGEVLLVSQFTLYANCKKGNRPSFFDAGEPDKAQALYEYMVEKVKERVPVVQTGTQFTLYANCKKGNRPSFFDAGEPDKAQALYEYMVEKVKERVPVVQTGTFGAMMKVSLINEGPFTIILDENTFQ